MQSHELEPLANSVTRLLRQAEEEDEEKLGSQGVLSRQYNPLAQATSNREDAASASVHSAALNRATGSQPSRAGHLLLQLQRQYGNRYVQRVLARASEGNGESEVAPEVEGAIQGARGGGQALDSNVRAQMESTFGADFSGVRVHTDAEADILNRAVSACAFTTGQDIFFREGEYNPGSSSGRELLVHELTHVVQQDAGHVQRKLTVGAPGNQHEQEAAKVAWAVTERESANQVLDAYRSDQAESRTFLPMVQRQDATTLPSADELTTRIARCIGIWETNRGKDTPAPKESSLDTVAGVHASMATIEQATMPYAITALKGHKELRDKASPPLTMKELNDAEARCTAVVTLVSSVTSASTKGKTPDDFIKNHAAAILATGLSNDDVKTMFSAVTLKSTLDKARADAEAEGKAAKEAVKEKKTAKGKAAAEKAAKQKAVKKAIDAIPAADRLGLGEGSLKVYINKPENWGENRAGWQRKAVASMPGNVGSRIEAVAVSDEGAALAIPVIKTRVNTELAKKPVPSLAEIVKAVAQQNNPGEMNYGKHVWETYDRLYD